MGDFAHKKAVVDPDGKEGPRSVSLPEVDNGQDADVVPVVGHVVVINADVGDKLGGTEESPQGVWFGGEVDTGQTGGIGSVGLQRVVSVDGVEF